MNNPWYMSKWLFGAVLVLAAHFSASYLVPLDQKAQETFWGLLRWFWPWADGDSGPLGDDRLLGVPGLRLLCRGDECGAPFPRRPGRGRHLDSVQLVAMEQHRGSRVSLFLMVMFFGPTKLIPIALDTFVLWAAWTNWAPAKG